MKLFHAPPYNSVRCPWCKTFATRVTAGSINQNTRYECQKQSCAKNGVLIWQTEDDCGLDSDDCKCGWRWYGKRFAPPSC